jgi:hypothetical protein
MALPYMPRLDLLVAATFLPSDQSIVIVHHRFHTVQAATVACDPLTTLSFLFFAD